MTSPWANVQCIQEMKMSEKDLFQRLETGHSYSDRTSRVVRRRGAVQEEGVNVGTRNRIKGMNADRNQARADRPRSRGDLFLTRKLGHIRRITGLEDGDIASAVRIPVAHLSKREAWTRDTRERFNEIVQLADRLDDTFEAESITVWLHSPSRDLRGRQPIELLRAGRIDEVDAALEALDSGVYI